MKTLRERFREFSAKGQIIGVHRESADCLDCDGRGYDGYQMKDGVPDLRFTRICKLCGGTGRVPNIEFLREDGMVFLTMEKEIEEFFDLLSEEWQEKIKSFG